MALLVVKNVYFTTFWPFLSPELPTLDLRYAEIVFIL